MKDKYIEAMRRMKNEKYRTLFDPSSPLYIRGADEEDYDDEENQEDKKMETKSRYEVIAELESKKRTLIKEREGFTDIVRDKKKEIRDSERDLEDEKEDLKEYEDSIDSRKETINELIKSIDDSLERFNKLSNSQKK